MSYQKKLKEKKKKLAAKRRKEAAERNKAHLEKNADKRKKMDDLRSAGKAAAPKVKEVDLKLATLVFTADSAGSIFIGRKTNALDENHLKELGITRVLNCAKEIPIPKFYSKRKIGSLHLECEDKSAFPIDDFFDEGVEYIRVCVDDEKLKVLVHCQEGRSRSTSMVVAYLIRYHGMNVNSALASIAARRQLIQPNSGFLEKLKIYEAQWGTSEIAADGAEEEEVEAADAGPSESAKPATAPAVPSESAKPAAAPATGDAGAADDEFDFED